MVIGFQQYMQYEEAKIQQQNTFEGPLEGFLGLYKPSCTLNPHGHFEKLAGM